MLDVWKSFIEGIGQEFKDVKIVHNTIHNFCIADGRNYVFVKNDLSMSPSNVHILDVDGTFILFILRIKINL